jgi:hypothetical protein
MLDPGFSVQSISESLVVQFKTKSKKIARQACRKSSRTCSNGELLEYNASRHVQSKIAGAGRIPLCGKFGAE